LPESGIEKYMDKAVRVSGFSVLPVGDPALNSFHAGRISAMALHQHRHYVSEGKAGSQNQQDGVHFLFALIARKVREQ
jgi:hypothetical protein